LQILTLACLPHLKDTACSTGALNHLQGTLLYSSVAGEGMRLQYPLITDSFYFCEKKSGQRVFLTRIAGLRNHGWECGRSRSKLLITRRYTYDDHLVVLIVFTVCTSCYSILNLNTGCLNQCSCWSDFYSSFNPLCLLGNGWIKCIPMKSCVILPFCSGLWQTIP